MIDPTYISIDPGSSRTGWVAWDDKAITLEILTLSETELDDKLDNLPSTVKLIMLEEYRVYGHLATAHIGSKVETAQVIGAIKKVARKLGIKVVEIRADAKYIAAKWSGTKVPPRKSHMSDKLAAYLIGYYQLHRMGLIRARVLDDK